MRSPKFGLLEIGVLSLLAYMGLANVHWRYGTLTFAQVPQSIGWLLLASVLYSVLIAWMASADRKQENSGSPDTHLIGIIFVGALLFRLVLLSTDPTLSSDIYRYLWDGYIANEGVSPYAYPINSPELDYLEAPVRSRANHAWMASPYLPAAQFLFGTVTRIAPLSPRSMQVAMILVDLLNGLLLAALLVRVGLPRTWAIIYLWNPLVILEVAHGAHVDAWMILLTLGTLWIGVGRWEAEGEGQVQQRLRSPGRMERIETRAGYFRYLAAPALLGLATLTKILPVLLMSVLFWRWRWGRLVIYGCVCVALLAAAGLRAGWGLVGPLDGQGLFGALRIYGEQWNFNSGLFHWLEVGLRDNVGFQPDVALAWAKRLVGLGMLGTLLVVWWRSYGEQEPRTMIRLMFVPLAAYVLLSPTFHPWYLLFLLSFLPFLAPTKEEPWQQWLLLAPWIYLSGALFLSYLTYLDPQNLREYEWVRRTEWLPALGLLLIGLCMWLPYFSGSTGSQVVDTG